MKKNGFTLAEVLITLAIIGVVATMTLPALMTNTGQQQYITGLKKGINTLTEAAQLSDALVGVNYGHLNTETAAFNGTFDANAPTLAGLLNERTQLDLAKIDKNRQPAKLFAEGASMNYTGNVAVFFRDGAALYYNTTYPAGAFNNADDGLPNGIPVIYDVNGLKSPNVLSNCVGAQKGADDRSDSTACDSDKNRIIGDQFAVKLRGTVAVPNSAAARWAFTQ